MSNTAFARADILLPKNENMEKWAVVACDQYTSEPEYWNETAKIVGENKSALKLILPEIYLEEEGVSERIEKIQKEMASYIESDTFTEYKNTLIYIERTQNDGKVRAGIVGAVDLEKYDYRKGSVSQVRATEATVVERIPPRMAVRRGAGLELPHIMILVDDPMKTVVEMVSASGDKELIYDFSLMQKGGSIKGWKLSDDLCEKVISALESLGDLDTFNKKYNLDEKFPLVYAMGDGNHSLATAKEFYEELKKNNPDKDLSNHPARYALCEIVNLHSEALEFEAIHRIVTNVDTDKLVGILSDELALSDEVSEQRIDIVIKGETVTKYVHKPVSKLAVGSLQIVLDRVLGEMGAKIDYIHGIEVVEKLSMAENSVGFVLQDMAKKDLFPTVICDGALPRKTFSMGHAWDKRYYVEARKIKE